MLRILKFCFVLLVLITGLAFHLRNEQIVVLDYYLGTVDLPFSLFLIVALCLGSILGMLASLPGFIKLKRDRDKLLNQVLIKEKEINNLRAIPMKDTH